MPSSALHEPILRWYAAHARDLPWRRPDTPAWGVLVSEFMLQQTPVSRVLEPYAAWLARWPTPADLAAEPAAEAVRAWGRLGYPRRALRLHAAATAIVARHGGAVPVSHSELRALPGVGDYTAAAVASFAFGAPHVVLDINVRRVLARSVVGQAQPSASVTIAERRIAEALLPEDGTAPRWAVATMELGAMICTARSPSCDRCPVQSACAWYGSGQRAYDGPRRRGQTYEGTDRQARGRILAVLRESTGPVSADAVATAWPEPTQRARALESLLADGLVAALPERQGFALGAG